MSVQAMSWVIEHSPHKGAELLCLLMIANYAHADGTGAYPSASRLAKDCRMSARQIVRMTHRLEESGALKIERNAGPRGANMMTVVMVEDAPKMTDAMDVAPDKLSYPKRSKSRPKKTASSDNLSDVLPSNGDMSPDKMSDVSLSGGDKSSPEPLTNSTSTPDIAMSDKPLLNRQLEPLEVNVSHETLRRPRDRGWEILSEFCGYEPKDLNERKLRNAVLRHLRTELKASDDDIALACERYCARWPEMERTAPAIAKHYERMLKEPARASPTSRHDRGMSFDQMMAKAARAEAGR